MSAMNMKTRKELVKFFRWINEFEDLKYTEKGINYYVDTYIVDIKEDIDED